MTQHSFTNIDDLYGKDESDDHLYGFPNQTSVTPLSTLFASAEIKSRPPCEIRCTDILNHIVMCPVCSKLYKEVEKNYQPQHQPQHKPQHQPQHLPQHQYQPLYQPRKEKFLPFLTSGASSGLKIAVVILGAILFIIILLYARSKFNNNVKVAPSSFSPYMNRR